MIVSTVPAPASQEHRLRGTDILLAVLLAGATVFVLTRWPHDLVQNDEGLFLYQAKRVLDGDIIYRDFFDVFAPGSIYLMALLFGLFGVSMETARLSMAVVHALIVVMVYGTCRHLGVRRSFAVVAAVSHPMICYPVQPMSSPHWMGTLLTLVVLRLALWRPRRSPYVWCGVLGLVNGLLLVTQHQKGAVIAPAVGLLILLEERVGKSHESPRHPARRLLAFAAGAGLVLIPVGAALLATAGGQQLYDALIYHPLVYYPRVNRHFWGQYSHMLSFRYPFAELFRQLPAITILALTRAACEAVAGTDPIRQRALLISGVMGAAAAGSVLYNPNYTHLGVIAPLYFILLAESTETILHGIEQYVPGLRLLGHAAACGLCLQLLHEGEQRRHARQEQYPFSHSTAFGRVDVKHEIEIGLLAAVREHLAVAPSREIFCYYCCASLYLTADALNPTRYQALLPGYSRPEQFAEVIDVLERRRVPVVIAHRFGALGGADDPLWRYLRTRYKPVSYWPERHLMWLLAVRQDLDGDAFF